MAKVDAIIEKINKLAKKGKYDAVLKYSTDSDDAIRTAVAVALAEFPSYNTGMALIPLLRDSAPNVRAAAATSAAAIGAKHCEEYVKKLAFADADPNVRMTAKAAFDKLKTSVV